MRIKTSDFSRLDSIKAPLGWAGLCVCFGLACLLVSYTHYDNETWTHASRDQVVDQLAGIEQLNSLLQQLGSENVEAAKSQLVTRLSDRIHVLGGLLEAADPDTREMAFEAIDRIQQFYRAHPDYYADSLWLTNRQDLRVVEAIRVAARTAR